MVQTCRQHRPSLRDRKADQPMPDIALIYALFGAVALTVIVLAVGGMRR